MIQQYLFQQMHNLIFIYDKLGIHVSAYQTIIRAPQSVLSALQHNTHYNEQEETLFTIQLLTIQFLIKHTLILHMTTYYITFKGFYLFWQNCILGIPSDCCPDDGLIGRNM
jgi:hypothetical protein